MNLLLADVHRQFGRSSHWLIAQAFLTRKTFRPVATLRACQWLAKRGVAARGFLPFLKIAHRWTANSIASDLSWQTKIGPGFILTHGWCTVISPGDILGSNITVFHGVTIGQGDRISRDGTRSTGFPVIESDVWLGPHSVIVGNITIGRGSRICAGAFVNDDVPAFSMVMGNPATIVKSDCTPDVANKAPMPE